MELPGETGVHAQTGRMALEAEGVPNTKALIGTELIMGMRYGEEPCMWDEVKVGVRFCWTSKTMKRRLDF